MREDKRMSFTLSRSQRIIASRAQVGSRTATSYGYSSRGA